MALQTELHITLNNSYKIPQTILQSFTLSFSFDFLPYGMIEISDAGSLLQEFPQLQVGSLFNYYTKDTSGNTYTSLIKYVVLYIEDQIEEFGTGKGTMNIYFGHPWYLYKNTTGEAYDAQLASKVIKSVIEDDSRGLAFSTGTWEESDGNAKPWFKFGCSDLEFVRMVLAKTTIGGFPSYLFCDQDGKFNLTCLHTMMNNTPYVLANTQHGKEIDNLGNTLTISVTSGPLTIGLDDPTAYKRYLAAEDKTNGTMAKGFMLPRAGAKKDLMPIDKTYLQAAGAGSFVAVKNECMSDALSVANNQSRDCDKIFFMKAKCNYNTDLKIGQTVFFNSPDNTLNGTWVIAAMTTTLSTNSGMELTLIRNKFYEKGAMKYSSKLFEVV